MFNQKIYKDMEELSKRMDDYRKRYPLETSLSALDSMPKAFSDFAKETGKLSSGMQELADALLDAQKVMREHLHEQVVAQCHQSDTRTRYKKTCHGVRAIWTRIRRRGLLAWVALGEEVPCTPSYIRISWGWLLYVIFALASYAFLMIWAMYQVR